jgi:cold shock CspA family protein
MRGSISQLVPERGFGLITDADGREYFFQRGALMGVDFEDLVPGIDVDFAPRPPDRGDEPGEHPRAVSIRLAPDAMAAPDHEQLSAEKTA